MSVILLVAALITSAISGIMSGLIYTKKHEDEPNNDVEATFSALVVTIILLVLWLFTFAIVFRNAIHV
jgi:hypothetical protein